MRRSRSEEPTPALHSTEAAVAEPHSVEVVFWESIKESTRAADYEAYLEQYPEGSFATLARTRLEEFASAGGGMRDPKDREVELAFWESVRESDNPATLQAYLEKYPGRGVQGPGRDPADGARGPPPYGLTAQARHEVARHRLGAGGGHSIAHLQSCADCLRLGQATTCQLLWKSLPFTWPALVSWVKV